MPVLRASDNPAVISKYGKVAAMLPRFSIKSTRPKRGPNRWYVVQTKAQQERQLALELSAKRVSYFLPMQETRVKRGSTRTVEGMRIIFPGYLFFCGDVKDLYALKDCQRHLQIITVNDQVKLERELEAVRVTIASIDAEIQWKSFVKGRRVRFIDGALKGEEATIQGTELKQGEVVVQLSISILGCASFTTEATNLELINADQEKGTTRTGAAGN